MMKKTFSGLALLAALTRVGAQAHAFPGNAAPGVQPKAAPAGSTVAAKGPVVETMDSGGYTYVCVESQGQKRWAAIPATPVKLGDVVEIAAGMEMQNFTSGSLNRTFETIIFSPGLVKR